MNQSRTMTLAGLATIRPAASHVFARHRLDYCCRGTRSLEAACEERGLDPERILAEIDEEERETPEPTVWATRPLAEIIRFIEGHYHARLRVELPELIQLARKVEGRHADKATCPRGLADHLEDVHVAVLSHLEKEERILFPLILDGRGPEAGAPVSVMEAEHRDHAVNLERTRQLATDLVPPAEACTSWQALYLRLDKLEAELMEHIHLENHVLFPRALRQSEEVAP